MMKNTLLGKNSLYAGAFALTALLATSCSTEEVTLQDEEVPKEQVSEFLPSSPTGKYIVIMNDGFVKSNTNLKTEKSFERRQTIAAKMITSAFKSYGIDAAKMDYVYSGAKIGFAGEIDESKLEALRADANVAFVEADQMIGLAPWWCYFFPWLCDDDDGGDDPQETPWGITRVGGATDMSNSSKKAWVIDTGIDLDHPDLNVDTQNSVSFVGGSPDDGQGHGTHVAGTIAAIDNNIGVIGVAAGAKVVAVKVLGDNGSGSTAGVVAGVDYVTQNAQSGDVANMSLGGGTSTALDNAVRALGASGVFVALAAGNESQNANNVSPARTNGANIYTISSTTSSNTLSGFSNFGNPPVDFAAPGSSIKSTWRGGGYNTISGTSMASPHAAGVLLVTNGQPSFSGTINGDRDSTPDRLISK